MEREGKTKQAVSAAEHVFLYVHYTHSSTITSLSVLRHQQNSAP